MSHFVLDARTATPHFPGIGRYVAGLARALMPLQESGEQTTLLLNADHLASRLHTVSLPVSPTPFSLAQQWAIPRLLRSLGTDLYHSPYYLMPYWPGLPTILTVYDLIPLRFPQYSSARARLLFRWAMRLALHAAVHVIAISDATRDDFLARFHLPADRIRTIPLAAGPEFHPQPADAMAAARARYGLPEHFTLYLGSNKPHKNLVRLIEAWALAQPQSMPLVIAGAWDPRYPEARQRAEALALGAQVQWLGPLAESDLPALYSGASLFVFPSLYEGFGLPVLEAMACGTPVVCSGTSSLPEVAGDAAHLVDPLDVNALADAIRRVLGSEEMRQELNESGLTRARAFSWERTAHRTLDLYRAYAHSSRL